MLGIKLCLSFQRRVTKLVRRLESKFGEVWLREQGVFRLERRLRVNTALCNHLKGDCNSMQVGIFSQLTVDKQKEIDSSWIPGRISFLEELSGIEADCLGKWWKHHRQKSSGNNWTWHLVLWLNWHGGVWWKVGLEDLGVLFQPYWFHDFVIKLPVTTRPFLLKYYFYYLEAAMEHAFLRNNKIIWEVYYCT